MANAPGGLICDDDLASRRALGAILTRNGFHTMAAVRSAEDLIANAGLPGVRVIVLDLALAGVAGLGIIPALRLAAPSSAIVVLSSFRDLRSAAVRAGAYDLIDPRDLRDLDRCLDRLSAEVDDRAAGPSGGGLDA